MRAGERGALVEYLDIMVFERVGVDAVEAIDIRKNGIAQRNPVERRALDVPAELLCVLEVLGKARSIDEHLLGHAATDHAGSADPVFLRHGNLRTMGSRDPAGAHPA